MHRRSPRPRAFTLLAAVVVALAASACSSLDADKAGGTRAKPPVVLTLANHQQGPDGVQYWIEEVQRRAGGSLRIQVTNRWFDQEFAHVGPAERDLGQQVRSSRWAGCRSAAAGPADSPNRTL